MAYREKTAWLTLGCMALAYSVYFPLIIMHPPARPLDIIVPFGAIATVQAVVVIAGSVFLALRSGGEARVPADERDRAIARRGANAGYYVLLVSMIVVGMFMPFTDPPAKIVNTALLAVVIAETVRLVIVIQSYRRGWHG